MKPRPLDYERLPMLIATIQAELGRADREFFQHGRARAACARQVNLADAMRTLREHHGARFAMHKGTSMVTLAGLTASSQLGLAAALLNWCDAARRRLHTIAMRKAA